MHNDPPHEDPTGRGKTYAIVSSHYYGISLEKPPRDLIKCFVCGKVSWDETDAKGLYCPWCCRFHER